MKNIDELRSAVAALRDEIAELSTLDDITPEQDARLDEALSELDTRTAELNKAEERAARVAAVREAQEAGTVTESRGVDSFQYMRRTETRVDAATAPISEVRDAARKIIDEARWTPDRKREAAERILFRNTGNLSGDKIARRLVVTETPEYRSAFLKGVLGRGDEMTEAERRAVSEVRAMSLTDTAGGYGVPVLIDPTVLITDGQGLTGILAYSRVETITNDAWKGVSAAHTAWSFDSEGAQVSDDASTFAQPEVPVYTARGFIPYSYEVGMDYPGFATEMGRLLEDGYLDLLAEKLATGAGSTEPTGVFTALDATAASEVTVVTDGVFQAADIDKVWKELPEKFRARATWFMNVDVENEIRAFGSGTATSRFTVDQTREGISLLNGRPVVLSDHAPEFTGTTGAANILVVGDFSNFLVAQRAGMTIRYIPDLFGANGRPTGQSGWFAYARVGSDVIVDNALRLLQNT